MGIRAERIKADMKIKDVAAACGVSRTAVYNWEHGITLPAASKLMRLAKLFGCSIDSLLD